MSTYFNTVREVGAQLDFYKDLAGKQDEVVFNFFKSNPRQGFLAEDVYKALYDERTPCSSIKRSCTVLMKQNKLIKTNHKALSSFGRLSHKYIFQPNEKLYTKPSKNKTA